MNNNENLKDSIHAAMPVSDSPEPPFPSVQLDCSHCKQKVWVDKKLVQVALKYKEILCIHCLFS